MSKPNNAETKSSRPARTKQAYKSQKEQAPPHLTAITDNIHQQEMTYDVDRINEFLDVILHAGMDENERIPIWLGVPRTPIRLPHGEEAALRHLRTTNKPYHCYYCTSTIHPEDSGKLSHKKANFETWRVLVLDDIGTKIPVENLPEVMREPTYIIESSPGNFQYGYVWRSPVEALEEAEAFLQIIAEANISDKGGLMPVKAVRLPCGVNGKMANVKDGYDKGVFPVRLVELHADRLWDPDQVLSALETRANWTDIQKDAKDTARRTAHTTMGGALWSDAAYPSTDGIVDPVLEWLNEIGDVKGDTGDFVNIECPWGHEHSTHNTAAGYRPLGRGSSPNTRAFHCFHDSCSSRTTADFLAHVASQGGPKGAVEDRVPHLTSTWVYDIIDNIVWKIRGGNDLLNVIPEAFNRDYAKPQKIVKADGTITMVPEHKLWLLSPARVTAYGRVLDPSTTARLIEEDGHLRINTFCPPRWPKTPPNPFHVKRFTDFMAYLVPNEEEREYFLNWLAAKMQNFAFRGAAILMVAKNQGTGRNTLADMVKRLMGENNCQMISLKNMLHDQFNDWQEYPMVFVEEIQAEGSTDSFNATYERLKEVVDVRPKKTTINPKYGKRRETMAYSSYMMFTNHTTALDFPVNDRRLYVMNNAVIPESEDYFTDLNEWLEADVWPVHVWNWLQQREVDLKQLTRPPKATAVKQQMSRASKSQMDVALGAILMHWPSAFICPNDVYAVLEMLADDISLYEVKNWDDKAKRYLRGATVGLGAKTLVADTAGRRSRIYLITARVTQGAFEADVLRNIDSLDAKDVLRRQIRAECKAASVEDLPTIAHQVSEYLTLNAL